MDGRLLGLKTKIDGMSFCEDKKKRTRGLSCRSRISRIVLGCGKEF
jgi:hypothetical protein